VAIPIKIFVGDSLVVGGFQMKQLQIAGIVNAQGNKTDLCPV